MKNLATLRNSYNGIRQAHHQWAQAIIENLKETGKEIKVLGDYYDPEDGWPEGLHIVIMDDDNYPQDIVIDSVKYEEKEYSNIAVHLCYWDPNKCDQWWSISDFSIDDADTILLAIQWPESIKQGEANAYEQKVRVLCYCDTTDNTKGVLLVTKIDGSLWEKRQAIDNAIRCAFYDQYEAEGVHPADEDEEVFEQVLDKLAAGQNADLYEYEIFWDNTVMV